MKFIFSVTLSLAILFFSISQSLACSCDYLPTHSVDFRKSKAVFIGEVIDANLKLSRPENLQNTPITQAVKFKVEKSWKGAKTSEFIAWAEYAGMCGFIPKVGEKYLVYAEKYKGNFIFSTFCSRTRPLETKYEDRMKELRELNSFGFRFWSNFAYFNFR